MSFKAQKNNGVFAGPGEALKMFHDVAGRERSHLHGRNSELRRMLNSDFKQVRRVVSDRVESLAIIKRGNESQGNGL